MDRPDFQEEIRELNLAYLMLAQQMLRHKSAKPAFRRVFWACVAGNILLFVLLFTPLLAQWRRV